MQEIYKNDKVQKAVILSTPISSKSKGHNAYIQYGPNMYIYTEFENNLLNTAEEVYTLKTVRGDDYTNSIRCLKWLSLKGCYSVKLNFIPSKLHMHIFIMSTKCMHGLKKILYKLWKTWITQTAYPII